MIITESASIHPTSNIGTQDTLWGFERAIIPSYRKIAEAVHGHGAKVVVQLSHQGRQGGSVEGLPRWAPSPVASRESSYGNNEVPHEMDSSEIEELVRAFAMCAAFAEEGGFDGVELHGAHGNLIHQFLSPLTNHRTDEYGGGLDNRLRFAMEVVRAVRGRVGRGFVVGMRISGDEFVDGGLDLEQMKEAARRLTAEGQVEGAVIQGLGLALYERMIYEGGDVVNGSFADYPLPRAEGAPPIQTILVETNDPYGPFGGKGGSETPIDPTAAAIANAVYNATGVRMTSLPVTAEKLLTALKK